MTWCLDSWAVLAWLEDDAAAARVDQVLDGAVMSWINLGEVAYIVQRRRGDQSSQRTVAELRQRLTLDLPTPARVLAAADLKGRHRLAYADAFAIATAVARRAVLLTGDPEIVDGDPAWPVQDLRVPG